MSAPVTRGVTRPRVAVAVCTFNRHEPLAVLLEAVATNARRLEGKVDVGVVVVDDSKDGNARPVVERFADRYGLGAHYRRSGKQNIALARNVGLETALGFADWVAMTDDDCEPAPHWIEKLLELQGRTGADAVTGILRRRVPPGSPRWLTDQPFLEAGLLEDVHDGDEVESGATHNSMISARWLREHPEVRFDPGFGVTGGEDPVFYRTAHAAGLRIHYSLQAEVFENEPDSRATYAYQLRTFFWLGNNAYLTMVRRGVPRIRMAGHGGRVTAGALLRPVGRAIRGQPPQLRYCLAATLRGLGMMTGILGVRVTHR